MIAFPTQVLYALLAMSAPELEVERLGLNPMLGTGRPLVKYPNKGAARYFLRCKKNVKPLNKLCLKEKT